MKVITKSDILQPISSIEYGECFKFGTEDGSWIYIKVNPSNCVVIGSDPLYVCLQTGKAYTSSVYNVIPVQIEATEL